MVTCPLCHARPARSRCHGCQRDVCAEDHWAMLRLCRGCVPDLGRWHREARAEERNWLETP